MKTLSIIFLTLLTFASMSAQQISKEIRNLNTDKVHIETEFFDLEVHTWDRDYIACEATVNTNDERHIKHFDVNVDNSTSGVSIETIIKFNNKLRLKCIKTESNMVVYLPKGMKLDVESEFGDVDIAGEYKKYDIQSEFGDVDIDCDGGYLSGYSNFDIEFGDLKLMLGDDQQATFHIDTDFGDVDTNMDVYRTGKNTYRLNEGEQNAIDVNISFGDVQLVSKQ